jgi:hypothetical protein
VRPGYLGPSALPKNGVLRSHAGLRPACSQREGALRASRLAAFAAGRGFARLGSQSYQALCVYGLCPAAGPLWAGPSEGAQLPGRRPGCCPAVGRAVSPLWAGPSEGAQLPCPASYLSVSFPQNIPSPFSFILTPNKSLWKACSV